MEITGQQVPNDSREINERLELEALLEAPFTVSFVCDAAPNGGPMAVSIGKTKPMDLTAAPPGRQASKKIGFAQALKVHA